MGNSFSASDSLILAKEKKEEKKRKAKKLKEIVDEVFIVTWNFPQRLLDFLL